MSREKKPECAKCRVLKCLWKEKEQKPADTCPMENYADIMEEMNKRLWEGEVRKLNVATEKVALGTYGRTGESKWTRVKEVMEFAKACGFKKLGIAMCVSMIEEARLLDNILERNGFNVASVCCMATGVAGDREKRPDIKKKIGIEEWGSFFDGPFCNPLMQAEILNREETELNIMVGLCVGHDALFIKNSKAYVTPLVVRDNVTGHNPVAALYGTIADLHPEKLYTFGFQTAKLFPLKPEGEAVVLEERLKDLREEVKRIEKKLINKGR